jgi:hypothetical protein
MRKRVLGKEEHYQERSAESSNKDPRALQRGGPARLFLSSTV